MELTECSVALMLRFVLKPSRGKCRLRTSPLLFRSIHSLSISHYYSMPRHNDSRLISLGQ